MKLTIGRTLGSDRHRQEQEPVSLEHFVRRLARRMSTIEPTKRRIETRSARHEADRHERGKEGQTCRQ